MKSKVFVRASVAVLVGLCAACLDPLKPPPATIGFVAEYPLVGHGAGSIITDLAGTYYVDDPVDRVLRRYASDGSPMPFQIATNDTVDLCSTPAFGRTNGLAYDEKRGITYVSYESTSVVRTLGGVYWTKCSEGISLNRPLGLAADFDQVFVADYNNRRIVRLSYDLQYIGDFYRMPGAAPPETIAAPVAVATSNDGRVYVSDAGGAYANASRVAVFDTEGRFVKSFGKQGSGKGDLRQPGGVAVDQAGRCIVADSGNHRVAIFDSTGEWLGNYGREGNLPGEFLGAGAVAVAPDGTILVLDTDRMRVIRLRLLERLFDH